MALGAPVRSRDRLRRRAPLAATGVVLAILVVGAMLWSAPRKDVADPGPGATPEQVVLAYVEALNNRDFETAERIDARPGEDFGRFSRPLQTHNIEGLRTRMEGSAAHVTFRAELDNADESLDEGWWGYVLERGGDGLWRITDSGVA